MKSLSCCMQTAPSKQHRKLKGVITLIGPAIASFLGYIGWEFYQESIAIQHLDHSSELAKVADDSPEVVVTRFDKNPLAGQVVVAIWKQSAWISPPIQVGTKIEDPPYRTDTSVPDGAIVFYIRSPHITRPLALRPWSFYYYRNGQVLPGVSINRFKTLCGLNVDQPHTALEPTPTAP